MPATWPRPQSVPSGGGDSPSGSGTYSYWVHHVQSVPSTEWIVVHNLGEYPAGLTVKDFAGTELVAEIVHDSKNRFRVLFTTPISGEVSN